MLPIPSEIGKVTLGTGPIGVSEKDLVLICPRWHEAFHDEVIRHHQRRRYRNEVSTFKREKADSFRKFDIVADQNAELHAVQLGDGGRAVAAAECVSVDFTEEMGFSMISEPPSVPIDQESGIVDPIILVPLRVTVEKRDPGGPGDFGGTLGRPAVDRFSKSRYDLPPDVISGQIHLRKHEQPRSSG